MSKCVHTKAEVQRLEDAFGCYMVDGFEVQPIGHNAEHNGKWRVICHCCGYDRTFHSTGTAPQLVKPIIVRVANYLRDLDANA